MTASEHNMKIQIRIVVPKFSIFSVNELMYLYSRNNPYISHMISNNKIFLFIDNVKYECETWTITPDDVNSNYEIVTIDLTSIE